MHQLRRCNFQRESGIIIATTRAVTTDATIGATIIAAIGTAGMCGSGAIIIGIGYGAAAGVIDKAVTL